MPIDGFNFETSQEYVNRAGLRSWKKFGAHYSPLSGLIINDGEACALREKVADIDLETLKEPRIAYFQTKNPGWSEGHELTCIAKMTVWMPLKYMLKKGCGFFNTSKLGSPVTMHVAWLQAWLLGFQSSKMVACARM